MEREDWLGVPSDEMTLEQARHAVKDLRKMLAEYLEQNPCEDVISRQAVLDAFGLSEKTRKYGGDHSGYDTLMKYEIQDILEDLPSVTPKEKIGHRRLMNPEWIDFLTEQFDISRTSAKEMLHAMMSVKKEDNIKKQFSQGKKVFSQGFSQG